MHILMVLDQNFPPDVRVENEAQSLVQAGFSVSLLSICTDDRPALEYWKGIDIYRVRVRKKFRNTLRGLVGAFDAYAYYLTHQILKVNRQKKIDALHAHDLYLVGGALRAGQKLKIPVVGDLHEHYVSALQHYAWSTAFPAKHLISIPRWQKRERRWVHAADHLIVVIEEAAARIQALGVPASKITVVSNTIQAKAFESYPLKKDICDTLTGDPLLVYTGGIDKHRGLVTVVDALPGLIPHYPNLQVYVIGAGRTLPHLKERTLARGVDQHFTFTGWQTQDLLKSYLFAADLCLIPHLKTDHTDATIPHKLFHYMYMRKPVLASNCNPIQRILEETGAGTVFQSGQIDSFQDAVHALMKKRSTWETMGNRGHQAVQQKYNWDVTAVQLVDLYKHLFSTDVSPSS